MKKVNKSLVRIYVTDRIAFVCIISVFSVCSKRRLIYKNKKFERIVWFHTVETQILIGHEMFTINQIRDQIVNDYKNINADIVEPLSYIKTLADPRGKILLIYKQVRSYYEFGLVKQFRSELGCY